MFNAKQNALMLEAVEALHKADALIQEAMGASDECYEIVCEIANIADNVLDVIQTSNPMVDAE
jgi:hypothetical protein